MNCAWFVPCARLTPALVLLALTLLPAAPPATARTPRVAAPDFAAIDAFVESEMQALRLPGLALAIVQGDQIVHLKGFGHADPSGRPVTPQTPFILGSVSKSFTALAVLQLVEQGTLDLDAPVQLYLPAFRVADPVASQAITVRHLLTQTSGLSTKVGRDQPSDLSDDALPQRVRSFHTLQLTQPVGTTYQYSGANYAILGLLVQAVSGQSYEAFIQEHIFAPLEMRQAATSQVAAHQQGMAMGYRYWFGLPVAADLPYNRASLPQGYLIASAEDLTHYVIAQLNAGRYEDVTILSPAGIAALQQPAARDGDSETWYGMGWKIGPVNGVPAIWHDGSVFNFHANIVLVPEGRWGVVILKNAYSFPDEVSGANRLTGIANGVTSLLVGQAPPAAASNMPTLLAYAALAGVVALQLAGMVRSTAALRRWRAQPERAPRGWLQVLLHVGLPLLVNLAWALAVLVGMPRVFGVPLAVLVAGIPDFGSILVVSGATALGWSVLRTALAWAALRERRAPSTASPVLQV